MIYITCIVYHQICSREKSLTRFLHLWKLCYAEYANCEIFTMLRNSKIKGFEKVWNIYEIVAIKSIKLLLRHCLWFGECEFNFLILKLRLLCVNNIKKSNISLRFHHKIDIIYFNIKCHKIYSFKNQNRLLKLFLPLFYTDLRSDQFNRNTSVFFNN